MFKKTCSSHIVCILFTLILEVLKYKVKSEIVWRVFINELLSKVAYVFNKQVKKDREPSDLIHILKAWNFAKIIFNKSKARAFLNLQFQHENSRIQAHKTESCLSFWDNGALCSLEQKRTASIHHINTSE